MSYKAAQAHLVCTKPYFNILKDSYFSLIVCLIDSGEKVAALEFKYDGDSDCYYI